MKKKELYGVTSNLFAVAAVIIPMLIYGGVKLAEKARDMRIYNNAARSASVYICEKYGYESAEAEVTSNRFINIVHGDCYEIFLNVTADGEASKVIVLSSEGGIDFADKFQYEQIKAAVSDEISESIPGARAAGMDIFAYTDILTGDSWGGYFDTYYDGDNLDKVLKGSFGYMEIVLADSGIDAFAVKESLDRLAEKWDFDVRKLRITYFDTEENMEKFIGEAKEKGNTYHLYDTYSEHIENDFDFSDNS